MKVTPKSNVVVFFFFKIVAGNEINELKKSKSLTTSLLQDSSDSFLFSDKRAKSPSRGLNLLNLNYTTRRFCLFCQTAHGEVKKNHYNIIF